jgi:uncharacterized protein YbgA (DUF1722 family)/uncharacterized protein YbbK (DUF523 family)
MRPRILLSRCIELASCRWNGFIVRESFVAKLLPFVDTVDVCPEVELGLGVPRDPVRLIRDDRTGETRLIQPATGRDLTDEMIRFSTGFMDAAGDLDGAILKSRSPSCGIHEARVHESAESPGSVEKASGLFAAVVLERIPRALVLHEGRLRNFAIREHWLSCIFTIARFREAAAKCMEDCRIGALVEFQASHKLLFLSWSRPWMERLGRIAANPGRLGLEEILSAYRAGLMETLGRAASAGRTMDVLQHALGYFKRSVSSEERAHFRHLLDMYLEGTLPLSACTSVLGSWIVRERQDYLAGQVFLHPYPAGLIEITDSGTGRDIRK